MCGCRYGNRKTGVTNTPVKGRYKIIQLEGVLRQTDVVQRCHIEENYRACTELCSSAQYKFRQMPEEQMRSKQCKSWLALLQGFSPINLLGCVNRVAFSFQRKWHDGITISLPNHVFLLQDFVDQKFVNLVS